MSTEQAPEVAALKEAGLDVEHVDVVEIGEAATSALDELDNIRWDDIWRRVDASDTDGDGLAHDSRQYLTYVRADIERIIAALTSEPRAAAPQEGDEG